MTLVSACSTVAIFACAAAEDAEADPFHAPPLSKKRWKQNDENDQPADKQKGEQNVIVHDVAPFLRVEDPIRLEARS